MHSAHTISLKILPDKLSTRSNNETSINPKLSINLSLCVIALLSSHFFLIGTEKVIYFSFFFFFLTHYLHKKKKFNLKTYNSTLLDIYGISVGEKLKKNIIILKIYT